MENLQELIETYMPCEVCGNNDITKFRLRVSSKDGHSAMMIKCDECEEVYPVKRKGYNE